MALPSVSFSCLPPLIRTGQPHRLLSAGLLRPLTAVTTSLLPPSSCATAASLSLSPPPILSSISPFPSVRYLSGHSTSERRCSHSLSDRPEEANGKGGHSELMPDFSCVGFVGLGNMGLPTALNLVAAGYKVIAHDLNSEAMEAAIKGGAQKAESVKDLASNVTFVFSMLPALEEVKSVYFGKDGILENLRSPGTFIVEASTIGPVGSAEVICEARKHGHRMLDSPVSGGITAASAGTLTFMVGGTDGEFKAVETFLRTIGRTIVHCGGATKGQAVKVCNNLILASSMMGVSEGFRLAQSLGVDLKLFNDVVNISTGRCWASELYNPVPGIMPNVPASREYKGGFGTKLMAKDLRIALDAAKSVKTSLPVTKEVSGMYDNIEKNGHAELDFSCVFIHNK